MASLNNFDARTVEPSKPMEPLPNGRYVVAITDSENRKMRSGTGEMLVLTYTVLEGEYRNRKLWDCLCTRHPDAKTTEIALSNLSAICHAVGVLCPGDSVDLHNIPMAVRIVCSPDRNSGELRNSVKGYFPVQEPTPVGVTDKPVTENHGNHHTDSSWG